MATIDQVKKHYDKLTAKERYALMVAARARGDMAERELLIQTAPKILFEYPHCKGLADGFEDLTNWHIMQQLGTAGFFWMLIYLNETSEGEIEAREREEIPTEETILTFTARRFLEGQEAYKAICQEYGLDPEVIQDSYNCFPELTAFTEIIMRKGFELSETELTGLEETKADYREVIEHSRELGAESKAK